MTKKLWCAPMLLLAFGCAHAPQAGKEQASDDSRAPIACTQIGCMDSLFVELKSPNAAWAQGSYQLALTMDGKDITCGFALPKDLPQAGHVGEIVCTQRSDADKDFVRLMINQEMVCTEQVTEQAVSSTCEPVPERYALQLHIPETPKTLSLSLTRDGQALLSRTYEPAYQESRPNGPQCEPLCRQARIEESL